MLVIEQDTEDKSIISPTYRVNTHKIKKHNHKKIKSFIALFRILKKDTKRSAVCIRRKKCII